ncbi:MAG: hypothetical protein CVU91_12890 [Firmicutes bacterium HGW-Firmicutes-16]|nr:MAG: hypothetical protein CVU91_12890 [Firmicutes bacterium HGW-Firmicutes-16]
MKCIPGGQLAYIASTIAIAISEQVPDNDELNVLSLLVTTIGDNLSLIAAQRQACPPKKEEC